MSNLNILEKKRRDILRRIQSLQTLKRKGDVLKLVRTGEGSLAIGGDEWDKNPMLLGVLNGVIDLETGILRPGKPEDYIKTIAPTIYCGLDCPSPIWERFISEVFDGDEKLVTYIQRLLGYGITGLTNYHVIPIFWGPNGRNGKSTILETLKYVLGETAHKTRPEALLESRFAPSRGAADADTLAFRGRRLIWASESEEGRSLEAARLKELCGGDTLNARAPYGKRPVEFQASHLLILITNNKPAAPANDNALWERIHLVPFNMRFVDNPSAPNERKADHDLQNKLKAEAAGIQTWLVKGCLEFQKIGLNPPVSVRCATSEYRADEDDIGQFIKEMFICSPDAFEKMGDIYHEYKLWHERCGLPGKPLSMKKLSPRLKSMGFVRDDSGRNVTFKGLRLRNKEDDL